MASILREQGVVDESECYIDASFASAKAGGKQIGPTRGGKRVKTMAIVDRHGLPLAVTTHAANHHEVTLRVVPQRPHWFAGGSAAFET